MKNRTLDCFENHHYLLLDDEDETLSIQLPALQMQLEEKKLQFDEENKRKQEQWREVGLFLDPLFLIYSRSDL